MMKGKYFALILLSLMVIVFQAIAVRAQANDITCTNEKLIIGDETDCTAHFYVQGGTISGIDDSSPEDCIVTYDILKLDSKGNFKFKLKILTANIPCYITVNYVYENTPATVKKEFEANPLNFISIWGPTQMVVGEEAIYEATLSQTTKIGQNSVPITEEPASISINTRPIDILAKTGQVWNINEEKITLKALKAGSVTLSVGAPGFKSDSKPITVTEKTAEIAKCTIKNVPDYTPFHFSLVIGDEKESLVSPETSFSKTPNAYQVKMMLDRYDKEPLKTELKSAGADDSQIATILSSLDTKIGQVIWTSPQGAGEKCV